MAYVNIPDSRLGIGIASLIGTLLGILTTRISSQLRSLQSKVENSCNDLGAIEKLIKTISGLKSFLQSVKSRIERVKKITQPLARILTILNIAIRLLKLLPLPNRFTTTGITNIFSDILHKLKEFLKQLRDDIQIINIACDQALALISNLEGQLNRLDITLKLCAEKESSENPQQLVNTQEQLTQEKGYDPEVIRSSILEDNFVKLGNELFKDPKVLQDFNFKSKEDQAVFANNLGLTRKQVGKASFSQNLSIGMPYNEALERSKLTPEEGKETLENIENNQSTTQDSILIPLSQTTLTTISPVTSTPTTLTPTTTVTSPEAGLVLVEDSIVKNQRLDTHIGPDGTVYDIYLQIVDESKVAPLRRAVARDKSNKIRYRSDDSFSYSTKVLVKEVKFNIDNDIN